MTETRDAEVQTIEFVQEAPASQVPAIPDKHAGAVEKRTRKPLPATGLRNIATALAAVTAEVGIVAKQGYNKFHGYKYAAMGDVLQRLTPLIGKHGLIIVQTEAENGRKMLDDGRAVAVEYEFTIAHSSGEVWPERPRQTGLCRSRDSKGGFDDKCFNKCHTAARKYFLLSLFQVATGDEDDADREQTGNAAKAPVAPAAPKPGPNVLPPHDPETGEITAPQSASAENRPATETLDKPPVAGTGISVEDMGREAAQRGHDQFIAYYRSRKGLERDRLRTIADEVGIPVEDMGRANARDGRGQLNLYYTSCSKADKEKLRAIKTELEALFPK